MEHFENHLHQRFYNQNEAIMSLNTSIPMLQYLGGIISFDIYLR